ncbi:MAG TPA: zinc ribbon domain-containing protein [Methanobacterium sp.]|nr:zinc ribbon domain-containing protein [Methanobacterium sp.]
MIFCPKCGTENKDNAEFCKNCGYNLKGPEKSFIGKLNDKINILGVYIGIAISLLVLVVASVLYGILVASGKLDVMGFVYLVSLSMMFIGGFVTSIICCKTYSEGLTNGGFVGLVSLVNFGFIVGILWFVAMAVLGAMANAFGSLGGSSASSAITNTSSSSYAPTNSTFSAGSVLPMVEVILLPILIILVGMAGGWFGVFIKKLVREGI